MWRRTRMPQLTHSCIYGRHTRELELVEGGIVFANRRKFPVIHPQLMMMDRFSRSHRVKYRGSCDSSMDLSMRNVSGLMGRMGEMRCHERERMTHA